MPIDLSLLTKIAEGIAGFIEYALKFKDEEREKFNKALNAILTAALNTRRYLAGQKQGIYHEQDEEARLMDLWKDASIGIHEFDKDLADLCLHEAEYWSDPPEWSFREINNAKRILRVITGKIEQLLMDR